MQSVATIEHEEAQIVTRNISAPVTPMEMLDRALSSGADPSVLEKLMNLQERWQANEARRAFIEARARAKAKIAAVKIVKNRVGNNDKRYADLDAYAKAIDAILAEEDLSYGFETEQTDRITVTCVLSHPAGHEQRNSLSGAPDSSGNKNAIQAIGSTVTYLQRYTLTAALGLSASEDDDDGRGAGNDDLITVEQVEELQSLIVDVGADLPKLLAFLKVERLEDIFARNFDRVKKVIEQKRAKGGR